MQIGMIGLGRMGGNMARRLTKGGHQCVVFDRNRENVNALAKEGPAPAYSLEELVEKLSAPRALWINPAAARSIPLGRTLPENNQTTYQKEHHNETNPNFKTSRAAALHLCTYCLCSHRRQYRRGLSDGR